MKQKSREGYDKLTYELMMDTPITDLSRYIGAHWFSSLEKLSQQSGVPYKTILRAVHGETIAGEMEQKLREFLENVNIRENKCVCCGAVIPEGRQVCLTCLCS